MYPECRDAGEEYPSGRTPIAAVDALWETFDEMGAEESFGDDDDGRTPQPGDQHEEPDGQPERVEQAEVDAVGVHDARSGERSRGERGADGDGPGGAGRDHADDADAEPRHPTEDRREDQQEHRRARDRPDLEPVVGRHAADAFVGRQEHDTHGDPAPEPSPHQAGDGSGAGSDDTRGSERGEHAVVVDGC